MTAPNREQFQNNASTTLNGAIDNSQTSITVTDGSVFPSTGNFRLIVESEYMLCTARSSDTLTVVRGIEGSTAASHSDSIVVTHILTDTALNRWLRDSVPLAGDDSTAPPLNKLVAADGVTPLTSASFSWANQGGAALTDGPAGTVSLRAPSSAAVSYRVAKLTAPATPYSLIAGIQCFAPRELDSNVGNPVCGLTWRESSSGKLHVFGLNSANGVPTRFLAEDMTNPTTWASLDRATITTPIFVGHVLWLKMEDNGTNLKYYASCDGVEWIQLLSHSRTALMSGGPDEIGITITNAQASSSFDAMLRLLHWHTE